MESNNFKNIKTIFLVILPYICTIFIQFFAILFDLLVLFIKNIVSDEKTVAVRSIGTIITNDYAQPMNKAFILFLQYAFFGIVFGIWYIKQIKPDIKANCSRTLKRLTTIYLLLAGCAIQIMVSSTLSLIRPCFESVFENYDSMIDGVFGASSSVLGYLCVFLLAPITEELIFRGLTLHYAKKILPPIVSILLQGFLFGIYHGNIIQGIYAFVLGTLLGFIAHQSKSLIPGMFLHIVINASALLVFKGMTSTLTASIITLAISTLVAAFCMFKWFKKNHNL